MRMDFKALTALLLVLASALALQVSAPSMVTVTQGRAVEAQVSFYNDFSSSDTVMVSFSSTLPALPKLSESTFTLSAYSRKNVTLAINAAGAEPGNYFIALTFAHTAGGGTSSKNITVEVTAPVRITPVYAGILTARGEFEYLKYSVQNQDSVTRNMVVDCSPLAAEFDAACPLSFFLAAGEVKEVHVGISVPSTYPAGEYEARVRLASGEFSVLSDPIMLKVQEAPVAALLEVRKVSISAFTAEGVTRGYNVTLGLRAAQGFENLTASGLPSGWKIENGVTNVSNGDANFSFTVIPLDFGEHKLELLLVEDGFVAASTPLFFSGTAVGVTGFAIGDGSLTVGILLAVIIVLVLLYVRLKGRLSEAEEESKTVNYFESLLEKAKKELTGAGAETEKSEQAGSKDKTEGEKKAEKPEDEAEESEEASQAEKQERLKRLLKAAEKELEDADVLKEKKTKRRRA